MWSLRGKTHNLNTLPITSSISTTGLAVFFGHAQTKQLRRYASDNTANCHLNHTDVFHCVEKINSARALDQDYLHACHCAFFRWFNLPYFVLWVIEKQPCLAGEFRFNMNGRQMIQGKNTQMRWHGVEENSTRASAGGTSLSWISLILCFLTTDLK